MRKGKKSDSVLLIDMLEQAFDKKAWHGTNLKGSLRGLKLNQLLYRPQPKRHNIWEIALHAAYWKYTVYRWLTNTKRGSFPRKPSNWPKIPENADLKAWRKDFALLRDQHIDLVGAVEAFPSSKLFEQIKGTPWNYAKLIYGVASHDIYHAGQIQLLKRLVK
jgi:uncharacterized damage-inducible protein DinB